MDACLNVYPTNAIYKHISHVEWCQNILFNKNEKKKIFKNKKNHDM